MLQKEKKQLKYGVDQVSLPRALSKLGFCSRSEAFKFITEGKVSVNGVPVNNPLLRVRPKKDKITVSGTALKQEAKVYFMLNKPRGLITTTKDDKERETVFKCFEGANMPYIFPVGRLDKASEGILLFTNDTKWADDVLSVKYDKVYHVQIKHASNEELLESLKKGVLCDGELLSAKNAAILRSGSVNSWLEITLDEGKNRHIRRLLKEHNIEVLRVIRVSIGNLKLGELKKGVWRKLLDKEVSDL
jgi:23S rRNA pseudouridine2605 synthase